MAHILKQELISHTRRVCSLYKRMCRDRDFWVDDFLDTRFEKLQIRAEFDKNKNIKDIRVAKAMLLQAEEDFQKTCHSYTESGIPYHPHSKDGIAYGRELLSPDYVMDYYHPLEKAQYPHYFAKREQMKDEYLALWRKKMMKPGEEENPPRS